MNNSEYIYGIHAVQSALQHHAEQVLDVWCDQQRRDKRIAQLVRSAEQVNVTIHYIERDKLNELSGTVKHQGVVARCKLISADTETDLFDIIDKFAKPLLIVLDGVQDPHNLGACLRTADAAGVHAVVAPKDRSVGITATVSKVASGAAQAVPFIQVTNLARTLEQLKQHGLWIVGTDEKATQSIYEMDFTGPTVIVMGAEGSGLRRLSKEKCDFLACLPMAGVVQSLNVSVATGICVFEAVRQRL